jgi:ABC-type nitrate/sulfonate/bicarbonate transport system substrate-binding protein
MLSLAVALTVCGCGAAGGPVRGDAELTLLLGSRPAGVHAGIFLAVERGFDEAEGLELTIRRTGDAARLLRSGRVDAAILEAPLPGTVCVMAITQQPRPGNFVCVTRTGLADRRGDVEALVQTLQRGYAETEVDPESAVQAVLTRVGGLDAATVTAELDAAAAGFEAGVPAFGYLRRGELPPGDYAYDLVRPVSRD